MLRALGSCHATLGRRRAGIRGSAPAKPATEVIKHAWFGWSEKAPESLDPEPVHGQHFGGHSPSRRCKPQQQVLSASLGSSQVLCLIDHALEDCFGPTGLGQVSIIRPRRTTFGAGLNVTPQLEAGNAY